MEAMEAKIIKETGIVEILVSRQFCRYVAYPCRPFLVMPPDEHQIPFILLSGCPTILFSAYNLTISIIVSREIFCFGKATKVF